MNWLGLILAVASIVFALISRKNIGYFDGLSLAGLIVGIFGIVFGIASIVILNSGYFDELLNEYEDIINNQNQGMIY